MKLKLPWSQMQTVFSLSSLNSLSSLKGGAATAAMAGEESSYLQNENPSPQPSPRLGGAREQGAASRRHTLAWGVGLLLLAAALTPCSAQTNSLTSLLQKGLFEEQASRDLDAAIVSYQTLAAQFDKDRQLAATAVFRLGECYRAQGKTNEAAVQYQRILKDFADQQTLVTLSRQNLAGMGIGQPTSQGVTANGAPEAASEILRLSSQITAIEKLKGDPEKQARTVQAMFPDEDLKRMLLHLPKLQAQETMFKDKLPEKIDGIIVAVPPSGRVDLLATGFPPSQASFGLKEAKAELLKQLQFISERVNFILGLQKERLQFLQSLASGGASGGAPQAHMTAVMDEEDQEIARIKQMVQNSPDLINAAGTDGRTPLANAASHDWLRVVKYLMDNDALMDNAALFAATSAGHKAMVELLLERGADVNARDGNQATPLHRAAEKGYLSMAEALIQRRADLNSRNDYQATPLHYAARAGWQAMVALLLAKGADINANDKSCGTPIRWAIVNDRFDTFSQLLKAGAKLDIEDKDGRTALSDAAERGKVEYVKALLAAKANPHAGKGDLRLRFAIPNPEILKLLLDAGANPNADKEHSILFTASGNSEALKLLLAAGADPNAKGAPLVSAIYAGKEESAALLVQAGADVNAPGVNGMTPLMMAVWKQNLPILSMLLTNKVEINARHSSGRSALDMSKYAEGGSNPINPGNYGGAFNSTDRDLARKISDLLRQHGALDELPDFTRIRITRQGLAQPLEVFQAGAKLTNQFTLLETVMRFYNNKYVNFPGQGVRPAWDGLPFPDFGRIIIRRPSPKIGGKETEIKVSLLNNSNVVDCAKDVPVQFGDVIEIPESVHALNAPTPNPVQEMEEAFDPNAPTVGVRPSESAARLARKAAYQSSTVCLQKSVQLVVAGETTTFKVNSWREGFLSKALGKTEARSALRSSSDLSRVKVTRQTGKPAKPLVFIVDAAGNGAGWDDLWLQDGDVIEVPEKK